jgi:hypothetical protein
MQKIELPWSELEEILKDLGKLHPEQEIKGITLVNPKTLFIYFDFKNKE